MPPTTSVLEDCGTLNFEALVVTSNADPELGLLRSAISVLHALWFKKAKRYTGKQEWDSHYAVGSTELSL